MNQYTESEIQLRMKNIIEYYKGTNDDHRSLNKDQLETLNAEININNVVIFVQNLKEVLLDLCNEAIKVAENTFKSSSHIKEINRLLNSGSRINNMDSIFGKNWAKNLKKLTDTDENIEQCFKKFMPKFCKSDFKKKFSENVRSFISKWNDSKDLFNAAYSSQVLFDYVNKIITIEDNVEEDTNDAVFDPEATIFESKAFREPTSYFHDDGDNDDDDDDDDEHNDKENDDDNNNNDKGNDGDDNNKDKRNNGDDDNNNNNAKGDNNANDFNDDSQNDNILSFEVIYSRYHKKLNLDFDTEIKQMRFSNLLDMEDLEDDEKDKKRKEEESERKRKEEAERKRKEEEAERKRKEEAERKRKEEEAERKRKEEAERKRKEEAERKRKEEEREQDELIKQEEAKQKAREEKLAQMMNAVSDLRERKLQAYRKAYIAKRQIIIEEQKSKKRDEAIDKFRESYRKQVLKSQCVKRETQKTVQKFEAEETASTNELLQNELHSLIDRMSSSNIVDFSGVDTTNPIAVRDFLQNKINSSHSRTFSESPEIENIKKDLPELQSKLEQSATEIKEAEAQKAQAITNVLNFKYLINDNENLINQHKNLAFSLYNVAKSVIECIRVILIYISKRRAEVTVQIPNEPIDDLQNFDGNIENYLGTEKDIYSLIDVMHEEIELLNKYLAEK